MPFHQIYSVEWNYQIKTKCQQLNSRKAHNNSINSANLHIQIDQSYYLKKSSELFLIQIQSQHCISKSKYHIIQIHINVQLWVSKIIEKSLQLCLKLWYWLKVYKIRLSFLFLLFSLQTIVLDFKKLAMF